MVDGDDGSGVWLSMLIQDLMGGFGFVTLIYLMTFVAVSMIFSWRILANHQYGDDDTSFKIISRYAETFLFKVHTAIYVVSLVVFVVEFLLERLASK